MKSGLTRMLAAMAAFGISPANITPALLARGRKRAPPTPRYPIARGAGSISAKADITQLALTGRYTEAREMAEAHERLCGEKLFPAAWWRTSDRSE